MKYFGDIIYQDERYTITDQWIMYRTEEINSGLDQYAERIGTLLSGESGLQKQYEGDFQLWIKAVRARELSTMHSYRRQAQDLLDKADYMQHMNGFYF